MMCYGFAGSLPSEVANTRFHVLKPRITTHWKELSFWSSFAMRDLVESDLIRKPASIVLCGNGDVTRDGFLHYTEPAILIRTLRRLHQLPIRKRCRRHKLSERIPENELVFA